MRLKLLLGGINALLSAGKLELISNDSIKMSLTEYPAFVNSFETAMNGLSNVVVNEQRIILERHYSLTDHLTDTIKYPNIKERALPSNFKSLLNDRAYQNVLVKVTHHLFVTRLEAEQLLTKTSELLEKIEREIENK